MTLKAPDHHTYEFLILDYSETGFIINRNQFSASILIEEEVQFASQINYLSSLIEYDGQTLPVFDFNAFINHTFNCNAESFFNIAIICNINLFSEENRSVYEEIVLRQNAEFSPAYIAFKVSAYAAIKHLPLSEIRFIPPVLKARLNTEGVLGCRFPSENMIQYFVDIETMIFKCIECQQI